MCCIFSSTPIASQKWIENHANSALLCGGILNSRLSLKMNGNQMSGRGRVALTVLDLGTQRARVDWDLAKNRCLSFSDNQQSVSELRCLGTTFAFVGYRRAQNAFERTSKGANEDPWVTYRSCWWVLLFCSIVFWLLYEYGIVSLFFCRLIRRIILLRNC